MFDLKDSRQAYEVFRVHWMIAHGYSVLDLVKNLEAIFIKKQEGDPIRTSSVKHFITLPSGVTYIQTKNTHYYLHPPAKGAAIKGVRV